MGADKPELLVNEEPLWSRQLRLLGELNPDTVWVSARARPSWCPRETDVVLDERPSRGPLSGLSAALDRLATSHLLAVAIDLPLMNASLLRRLWQLAEPGRGVIPQSGTWFEPLCAIYPAEAALEAQAALQSGRLSLQQLIQKLIAQKRLHVYRVPAREQPLFANVNTREALERCRHVIR
jgi:molybdopterin-guanine dinucleotide biosynthesis protein A